ncbi:3-deoxy-manno-octulosonate cytidylyltransferase [Geminicoccaceae bacterium 1502E]|nr:3-deoxy-manno-octulosonate cytidylyltransferase [Geminicoccaceae bacterium 1502E]
MIEAPSTPGVGDTKPHTIVMIPARLASTRLPYKPLADIAGAPMIVHVWRRAMEAAIGPVVVACAEREIAQVVEEAGGTAVLTDPELPSGTDRIHQALERLDPQGSYQTVVNLQGDLPVLDPSVLQRVVEPLDALGADIGTLAAPTAEEEERTSPNVVKAVISFDRPEAQQGRALYFTRAPAPWGSGPVWHHIGIYSFRREALRRFCGLRPSLLEQREKLEQLRAMENGMSIGVRLVETVPFGVDTAADLERARLILGHRPAAS